MSEKWVRKIEYRGFESEEEAKKFLEESERFFRETFQRMRDWHRRMWESFDRLFEDLSEPFIRTEPKPTHYLERAGDVYERLEKLDSDVDELKKDMREVKELLLTKYLKKRVKTA